MSATPIGAISPGARGPAHLVGEAERARLEVQRPPSRSPFEYAVVRVVPDIEREEFVNAGLILLPAAQLAARTSLDEEALVGTQARLRYRRHPAARLHRGRGGDRWPPGRSPG